MVLGLGGCVDYEVVWDPVVVQDLVDHYRIGAGEVDPSVPVRSERDLLRSVLGLVEQGIGGERFVASSAIVEAFTARFDRRATLGGTNVRAATAMSRIGMPSTLHLVSVDDTVRRLLPPDVGYVCSAGRDTFDPHLIVQYPAGARVRLGRRELVAPRANRLIYVNDPPNRELLLSPELGRMLEPARIFLVSGFNAMRDPVALTARLTELRERMTRLPEGALVLFEDAGYHLPGMSALVRERLVDRVDVYGVNEDELQEHVGRSVDLLAPGQLAEALRDLRLAVPARTLVVHTAAWALAFGPEAESCRPALESATAMAGVRYLYGDAFTVADHAGMAGRPRHPEGAALAAGLSAILGGEVCCVPAYSLSTSTPTLVGLGDAFVGGFVASLAAALR